MHTTDITCHMPHITSVLVEDISKATLQVCVINVIAFVRPLGELLDDALEVENAVMACLHGVVAKVFRLTTWVIRLVCFAIAKPESGIVGKVCLNEFLKFPMVALGIVSVEHGSVTPLDGPDIVIVDSWEESLA